MQKMFKLGDIQSNVPTPDKELNILAHGIPFSMSSYIQAL